jgi:hypothetical protein
VTDCDPLELDAVGQRFVALERRRAGNTWTEKKKQKKTIFWVIISDLNQLTNDVWSLRLPVISMVLWSRPNRFSPWQV